MRLYRTTLPLVQGLLRPLQSRVTGDGAALTARQVIRRDATTTPTGAILPEPKKTPFGWLGLVCSVVPGLLIGAAISKTMANFLEENDLFVPSDDDDDDD